MRIFLITDKIAENQKPRIETALEKIKADYAGVSDVSWQYDFKDLSQLPWAPTGDGSFILQARYLNDFTKGFFQEHNEEFDHVIYVFDPQNWKAGSFSGWWGGKYLTSAIVGGWSLGSLYNSYSVQLVKIAESDEWLYKIFAMEIFHAIDDFALIELQTNLDKVLGLNFDESIVHGANPNYTVYEYRKPILELKDYISKIYGRRKARYDALMNGLKLKVSLLQRLIELYTQLIMLRKLKKNIEPVIIERS